MVKLPLQPVVSIHWSECSSNNRSNSVCCHSGFAGAMLSCAQSCKGIEISINNKNFFMFQLSESYGDFHFCGAVAHEVVIEHGLCIE